MWQVPIHGWVYQPQNSSVRKKAFTTVLKKSYGLETTLATEANLSERVNLLISDNKRGKRVVIELAGQRYTLPESAANGHINALLKIPARDIRSNQQGRISFTVILAPDDRRTFTGEARLLDPIGISVISDIDDTVKITEVTDRKSLLDNTFFRDFKAVEGMASLYQRWQGEGVNIHFVSSSPWHLYRPLVTFLKDKGFPASTLSLKPVRFKDKSLLDLFKKGTATKPKAIEEILNAFPKRTFILVGDSGEQDAEVYAMIAKKYPEQISRVLIRSITMPIDREKYTVIFSGVKSEIWQVFTDPSEISL